MAGQMKKSPLTENKMEETPSPEREKPSSDVSGGSLFSSEDAVYITERMEHADHLPMGGLSEEETDDLNSLITRLRKGASGNSSISDVNEAQKQIRSLEGRLSYIGELILKFDNSLKILFELVRLFQRKSEILNHRIKEMENHLQRNE